MRCPGCGTEGEGNFCARCGAPLVEGGRTCGKCGAGLSTGDLFCAECGEPAGERPAKRASARLPWILSALALVLFSVGIAFLVQRWTAPRPPGGVITGGIPPAPGGAPRAGDAGMAGGDAAGEAPSGGATAGAMPSAAELEAMPPRVAADRLFDRAMTERESGDSERAAFFARMGLQAYGRVSPAEMDDDARFHVGLLHLAAGDLAGARGVSDALLAEDPDHLFGLVLGARAADAAGDPAGAADYRDRLRSAIAAGESPQQAPWAPHAALIRREAGPAAGG